MHTYKSLFARISVLLLCLTIVFGSFIVPAKAAPFKVNHMAMLAKHDFIFAGVDYSSKKDSMINVAYAMLRADNYEIAFVAGVLANIAYEASSSAFENISGYTSVYAKWKSNNPSFETIEAAYNAGFVVSTDFAKPAGGIAAAMQRGDLAKVIYTALAPDSVHSTQVSQISNSYQTNQGTISYQTIPSVMSSNTLILTIGVWPVDASNKDIVITSDNENVVYVGNMIVSNGKNGKTFTLNRGTANGTARISVYSTDGSKASYSFSITCENTTSVNPETPANPVSPTTPQTPADPAPPTNPQTPTNPAPAVQPIQISISYDRSAFTNGQPITVTYSVTGGSGAYAIDYWMNGWNDETNSVCDYFGDSAWNRRSGNYTSPATKTITYYPEDFTHIHFMVDLYDSSGTSATMSGDVLTRSAGGPTVKFSKLKSSSAKKVTAALKASTKMVKFEVAYRIKGTTSWKKTSVKVSSKGSKTATKVISSLMSKKTYEFRVRGQYKVNGHKYYTDWSKPKSVKIK